MVLKFVLLHGQVKQSLRLMHRVWKITIVPVDDSDDDSVPELLGWNEVSLSDDDSSIGSGERDVPQCRDDYFSDDDSIPSLETRSSRHSGNDLELSFSLDSEGGSNASDSDSLFSDDDSLDSEYVRLINHTAFVAQRPYRQMRIGHCCLGDLGILLRLS